MNKTISAVVLTTLISAPAFAHDVTIGYANTEFSAGGESDTASGIAASYSHTFQDSDFGVMATGSVVTDSEQVTVGNQYYSFSYNLDLVRSSLLVGPTYSFNEYVTVYGVVGGNHTEITYSKTRVGVDSDNFAYGAGIKVTPFKRLVLKAGYEGSTADFKGMDTTQLKTFTIEAGLRF